MAPFATMMKMIAPAVRSAVALLVRITMTAGQSIAFDGYLAVVVFPHVFTHGDGVVIEPAVEHLMFLGGASHIADERHDAILLCVVEPVPGHDIVALGSS